MLRARQKRLKREGGAIRAGGLIVLVLAVIFAFLWYQHSGEEQADQTEAAKEKKRAVERQAFERELDQLRERTGASLAWEKRLSDPLGTIFTLDVERAWLRGGLILFPGIMEDVRSATEADYTVLVEYSGVKRLYVGRYGFRLELLCEKRKIDEILAKVLPNKWSLDLGVVIAAQVVGIRREESGTVPTEDEEVVKLDEDVTFTGLGRCVDLIPMAQPLWIKPGLLDSRTSSSAP